MRFWGIILLVMAGVFAFVVGSRLSADAVGMAIGVLFGVLAGIPTALLVLASGRRRRAEEEEEEMDDGYAGRYGRRGAHPYGAFPPQAPVIVFAPPAAPPQGQPGNYVYGGQPNGYGAPPALPGPAQRTIDGGRAFKVVGEQEEWITEW